MMKKLMTVLLAAAMTVSAACMTAFAEEEPSRDVMLDEVALEYFHAKPVYALGEDISAYAPGDVNMDSAIDAKDATLVMIEVNAYTVIEAGHLLDEQQRQLADVNPAMARKQKDAIGLNDAYLILLYSNYTQIGGEMGAAQFYAAWNSGDSSAIVL